MTAARITLRTLGTVNGQQVYDQLARHMMTQRATSYGYGGVVCAYRGKDGRRCPAGDVIADDEYDADAMEDLSWDALVRRGIVPPHHEALIRQLQFVHDEYAPEEWPEALRRVAERNELEPIAEVLA